MLGTDRHMDAAGASVTGRRPGRFGSVRLRQVRSGLLGACALGAVLAALVAAPGGAARSTANPVLYINFFANGTIAVQTADGTNVGASSGTPTVIPAGYYTLIFSGPGGCSILPYFHLTGPGIAIDTNMNEGQVTRAPSSVDFQPGSTYTWTDDALPGVVYTFTTSSQEVGAPPVAAGSADTAVTNSPVSSQDVVGSDVVVPYLGTLTGSVSTAGKVSLVYKGKPATSVKQGRYTVKAAGGNAGFVLKPASIATSILPVSVTGSHAVSVDLTAGKWVLVPRVGKTTFSFSVS